MKKLFLIFCFSSFVLAGNALVYLSDFGLKDGAVSSMKGVAYSIDNDLKMFDLTHEITPYDVFEGAYRFNQSAEFWPSGTVFVGVVDPGVGTSRAGIVLKTKNNYYFVGPDNGLFSLVAKKFGIAEVRVIDENKNRLKGSSDSHTFHGRDVFSYVGAKLAAKKLKFEDVGSVLKDEIIKLEYQEALVKDNYALGNIPILDIQYGNVWTNINKVVFEKLNVKNGDNFMVEIYNDKTLVYKGKMPFTNSFGDVKLGEPLLYYNSLMNVAVALNMDSFAQKHNVSSGAKWSIKIIKE